MQIEVVTVESQVLRAMGLFLVLEPFLLPDLIPRSGSTQGLEPIMCIPHAHLSMCLGALPRLQGPFILAFVTEGISFQQMFIAPHQYSAHHYAGY